MVEHRTGGERQFIDPVVSAIEGSDGYELVFYANAVTHMKLEIFIGESGLIEASHFVLGRAKHKKPLYCAFLRENGEDAWHNYCLVVYRLLYKDFLL